MSATVTQKQIADFVGVTPVLVSRALSGHPSVATHTRERVEQAARQLGYGAYTNQSAREMAAQRHGKRIPTDIIAVLMPDSIFAGVALPNVPFFAPLMAGLEGAALASGKDVYLCTPHGGRLPHLIARRGVDGVVCMGSLDLELAATELPVICFGGPAPGMTALVPDNRAGARLATRHLLDLGHRRIACLAFSASFWSGHRYAAAADRMDGYKDALLEAGIAVDESLIGGHVAHPTIEAGAEGMASLLQSAGDFTAVVCFNDLIAMGAIDVLRQAGRRVPEDISVAGFDDVSEHYSSIPITSIRFDRFAMGQRAVRLIGAAGGSPLTVAPDEVFPVQLVVRNSTAPAPITPRPLPPTSLAATGPR